jgi:hypothetical protein
VKDRERELRERRLGEQLRRLEAPDERGAEARGWRVVAAARAGAAAGPAAAERRGRSRRRALQAALAVGLVAILVSPAGASVRHWVADRVEPGVEHARPVLTSLPAHGSLLVQSARGTWVVHPDGAKRLLGDYGESSWSPHGLFVVATDGHELAALKPDGTVRWTLDRPGRVHLARWNGPDGYRIAYLDGRGLRVVDGDGSDDRPLAGSAAAVAPAWRPGPDHVLAFARRDGAVAALGADSGARLFETGPGPRPISLQWTVGDLLVVRPGALALFDGRGRLRWHWAAPAGTTIRGATVAPRGASVSAEAPGASGPGAIGGTGKPAALRGTRIAAVLRDSDGGGSRLLVVGPGRPPRTLFAGPGRFAAAQWSPGGDRLLLPWPSADQWLFLDPSGGAGKLDAVGNVAGQFAPGAAGPAAFPSVAGWCCSR